MLLPGDEEAVFVPLVDLYAERAHHIERDVDIGAALDRGEDAERAVRREQRQREEQTRDKLAAHVAAQGVFPRGERALKRDAALALFDPDACAGQDVLIDADAALQKPRRAGKDGAPAGDERRRDAEAEGASALAAGVDGAFRGAPAGAGDVGGIALQTGGAAHGADTVERRGHVLAARDAADAALTRGEGGAKEHPVAAALRGRRADRAAGRAGGDGDGHSACAPFRRMSIASQ